MGQQCRSTGERDSSVLSAPLSDGEGENVGVDSLHGRAALRSQCDAEERNAVAASGESSGLILRQFAKTCPRTDINIILQDVTLTTSDPNYF